MIHQSILAALTTHYERLDEEGGAAPSGFQKQEIPFLIVLDPDGRFRGIQDTRQGAGKKKSARAFTVPKGEKKTSGIAPNLLWDNPAYLFGCPKPDPKKPAEELTQRARKAQAAFLERLQRTFPDPEEDEGIRAVRAFLEKGDYENVFNHSLWSEIEESGANLTFQMEGEQGLVCQRAAVKKALMVRLEGQSENPQLCLVTGEDDIPVRLHTAIKGVWGAQTSGANIISFNLPAFNSYGKDQGFNAPVGERAEFAYTTALNTLLAKGSNQRIQVGDASTVFWAARPNPMEDVFADFFGIPAEKGAGPDPNSIKVLFAAPRSGAPPLDEDLTPFYVLGLAPNAARLAVRFWYAGTVAEAARHIRTHFEDCSIVHGERQPDHLSLFQMLLSTAVQHKADNIQPNLAGSVMQAILKGTPYPQTLLASAIRRVQAEREITYPRAALIKAVLARDSRLNTRFQMTNGREVDMSLDPQNTNPGYRLGRLFAVLERAQELASPNVNATIRDRFYGSASSTPVAAFAHLMKLKNHHLAKLEHPGVRINLERLIGEIMDGLQDFPPHLALADQGRFAVGYYHQRQNFFTKKDITETSAK